MICLVIIGHIIYPNGDLAFSKDFRIWIYSLHIPSFFIISGLLKNKTGYLYKINTIKQAFRKQTKCIKYYVIFSFVFFIRYTVQYFVGINSGSDLLLFLFNSITMLGMGALWFLPAFIFSDLLFFSIFKFKWLRILFLLSIILF